MAGESLTISTKQQLPIFGKRFPQSPKGRLKFLIRVSDDLLTGVIRTASLIVGC